MSTQGTEVDVMPEPFDITSMVESPRVRAALLGELSPDELTPSEEGLYDDLIALMPPSKESIEFFANMREKGGAVGIDEEGRLVRLLPGGKAVPMR